MGSVKDISEDKLVRLADYLDDFPPLAPGQRDEDVEQYYCALFVELSRLPHPLGTKFTYSRTQMTDFGMATGKGGSPSLDLLRDLQKKRLPLDHFIACLERIGCRRAVNEFTAATRPEILVQPQSHKLLEGGTLCLQCQAKCSPGTPQYSWFWKREDGPNRQWEPVKNSNTNRLVIENVNTAHTGSYTCRATNPHINDLQGAVFSEYVSVVVEGTEIQQKTPIRQATSDLPPTFPPFITTQPQSVRVDYGQPATLHCQAGGTNITYDWFRGEKYISSHGGSGGSLVLKRAKLEDGGQYHCKVTNPQGGSADSDTVTITVDPVIVIDRQPLREIRRDRGTRIELTCSAHSARGPVVYQWFKNKRKIRGATSGVYQDTLQCRSDSNTYTLHCQVGLKDYPDQLPMVSSTTRVTVICVKITDQPRDVQGEIGGSASLRCRAEIIAPSSTSEKIEYIWLKSDRKGGKKDPLSPALKAKQSKGCLQFEALQIIHDGFYVCQACRKGEWVESDEVHLMVTTPGAPTVSIVRHPVSWVVASGGEFKMRCKARVTPPQSLHYQWFRDNNPIPDETASELTICSNDYASYYCRVQTADGRAFASSDSAYTHPPLTEQTLVRGAPLENYEGEEKLSTLSGQKYAREKIALLIGNQKYDAPDLNMLQFTEEEVRDVAEKLKQLHFKVFTFVNLRLTEMNDVINWFCSLLSAGVYGLFYFSGHGFNSGSTSYLMPVDSPDGPPTTNMCVATDLVANKMQKTACRAVMVLDCCQVFVNESIPSGAITPVEALNVANIVEIHSTPRGNVAYEKSSFSPSFIEALDHNRDVNSLNQDILDKMRKKGDMATPWHSGIMKDAISLTDPIMRDDMRKEEEAERICDVWEQVQTCPAPAALDLGAGLSNLLSVMLRCTTQFTNVLTVKVELNCKQTNIEPALTLDRESLRGQGVEAETKTDKEDSLCYVITVMNIQRLKGPLSLPVVLTVCVPGSADISEKITYKFPELPVNKFLKHGS